VVAPSQAGPRVRPKKKIVVDLLCLCVEHSRLVERLAVDTVRYVVDSALGEMYREGEFRLEPLWAILAKEPGITTEMSAAPLLAFKALDEQANLRVRLPADVLALAPLRASELGREVLLPAARLSALLEELRAADQNTAAHVEARAARTATGRFTVTKGPRTGTNPTITGPVQKAPPSRGRLYALVAALVALIAVAALLALK
jgi:hypothetical protein